MDQTRPGTIAMLAGGAVLLISTFLDWQKVDFGIASASANAWDRGLSGFFLLFIAGIAMGIAGVTAFAPLVDLPGQVMGSTLTQVVMLLGASALVFSFCMLFAFEGFQIGTILAFASSAAVTAGGYMENTAEADQPPRPI